MTELSTDRLILRHWRAEDREPFAALNDDPAVMEHFPNHLTRAQSDAMLDRITTFLDEHGWGPARASVAHGFGPLGLDEIVAMVVRDNIRSQGVMRKLAMTRDEDADFDHPLIPDGSPVRRHRLYRLGRDDWGSRQQALTFSA